MSAPLFSAAMVEKNLEAKVAAVFADEAFTTALDKFLAKKVDVLPYILEPTDELEALFDKHGISNRVLNAWFQGTGAGVNHFRSYFATRGIQVAVALFGRQWKLYPNTSESAKPKESAKPSESSKPSESTKPKESDKPSESTKPSATAPPAASTAPADRKDANDSDSDSDSEMDEALMEALSKSLIGSILLKGGAPRKCFCGKCEPRS